MVFDKIFEEFVRSDYVSNQLDCALSTCHMILIGLQK